MAKKSHQHAKAIVKHDNGELGEDVRPERQWIAGEEKVEAELLGTFPASDPPSHWAGEPPPGARSGRIWMTRIGSPS